jgi:RNA polymerase sigma-32 factor
MNSIEIYNQYRRSIQQNTILSVEEEYDLAMKLKTSGDIESAKKLVVSNLKFVVKIARGYSGYGLPESDLIQEGNIGLMKAVKRFDPERGVRLISFAVYSIKAEIHEYIIKNWRIVRMATTKAQRKLFFNLRNMKKSLKSLKSDEIKYIAKELKVKEKDVREMEYRFEGNEISFDYVDDDNEDDFYRPVSYLKNTSPDPLDIIINEESNKFEELHKVIAKLDERSQFVVKSRWINDDNLLTLHQVADKLDISAERVRQIEKKAMKKIKLLLTS